MVRKTETCKFVPGVHFSATLKPVASTIMSETFLQECRLHSDGTYELSGINVSIGEWLLAILCILYSDILCVRTSLPSSCMYRVSQKCSPEFLPARRCASAGLCDSDVSVRPFVRLSIRPSHAGIVPSRAKTGS